MGARVLSKLIFVVFGMAMVWIGVGFLAFAIAAGLTPYVGMAWAAAIAAALLLMPALLVVLILGRKPPPSKFGLGGETTLFAVISTLVRDKPLLAILGAGLFGAAEVWLNRKKK
jgi:hypothetical protein